MNQGEEAWLVSEHFDPSDADCFTFWYHMYGSGMYAMLSVHPLPCSCYSNMTVFFNSI